MTHNYSIDEKTIEYYDNEIKRTYRREFRDKGVEFWDRRIEFIAVVLSIPIAFLCIFGAIGYLTLKNQALLNRSAIEYSEFIQTL